MKKSRLRSVSSHHSLFTFFFTIHTLLFYRILHGHRPYWYVKQNDLMQLNQFGLKQSPITCETGPGLPSGHVMVNVVTGKEFL